MPTPRARWDAPNGLDRGGQESMAAVGARGEHPHREPIVRSRSLVGDACDDLDEVTVAEHR